MSDHGLRSAEAPPATSSDARQAVVNEASSEKQATLTAYMSGYFEGEGCVAFNPKKSKSSSLGFCMTPEVAVGTAQMAGLFDGEGSMNALVRERETGSHGHGFAPQIEVTQATQNTIVGGLFEDYCEPRGIEYSVSISEREDRPEHSALVRCAIANAEGVEAFLEPLIPLLREKRRQAVIMVDEILPRYREGQHLNKRGFLELMRWKQELDKNKPMDDKDRKYTYDYFAHELGWLEDVEQQKRLESWE